MKNLKKSSEEVSSKELEKFGVDYKRHLFLLGIPEPNWNTLEHKAMFVEEILKIESERLQRLVHGLCQNHVTMNQATLSKSTEMIKEVRVSIDLYLRLYYFFTYEDYNFES